NISHPYLSQIETGKNTKPSADILFKVSTALKVNVISLFYYAGYISQEQLASQLNVSLIESDIREDIRDSLYSLTNKENGFFLPYLKKDIINLISNELKAPVSHMVDSNELLNPEDKIYFKKQLNKYLSHDIEESIDDSDIREAIRDSLYSLTNKENGFFLPYLKKDIINLISNELKAPVSHMVDSNELLNPEDKIYFKKQLNKYLSHDIEESIDDSDIKDIFNKVYNPLNIMSVIESNITEFDNKKLISFHNALLELGNIYQNRIKQDNLIDIHELILKPNVKYK